MAIDAISDIGATVQASGGEEILEPCYLDSDDSQKAGELCYLASGVAKAIDGNSATAGLAFVGIIARHPDYGLDDVVGNAAGSVKGNLMRPVSGRLYRVFCEDFGAAGPIGSPLTFATTTPGSVMVVATTTGKLETGNIIGYLEKAVVNTQLVCVMRWA